MRLRKLGLVLLALYVVWSSGAKRPVQPQEGVRIYFVAQSDTHHGPALGSELYNGPLVTPKAVPGPRALMTALLRGPRGEQLRSPFPEGVELESWRWEPGKPGALQLRLTEQYSGLTDIDLTLADYCIVLTLSQIPHVRTVEIFSGGYTAGYREHQKLNREEAVLVDSLARKEPPASA